MSQGRKWRVEPPLFVPADVVYEHIPKQHFYERLAKVLDLEFVRELTRPLYAEKMGRPSLDPVVFFKCMLAGFFENIVYDTELEYRIADSLTIRKFLGYGLDERTPDESTLRKTRQRMPEEVFRAVFDHVLSICQARGLVRGRALGMDSTLVDANASMDSLRHRELGCTYEEYVVALRRQDAPEAGREEAAREDKGRHGKVNNSDWRSTTDPEARVMLHGNGHSHLSYKVDTTVDLETGVIVAAGSERGDLSDQIDCLQRVDEATAALAAMGLSPEVVVADKGHHCGENLRGIEERGLVALIASPNQKWGAPGYQRDNFVHDLEGDRMICPAGHVMRRVRTREENIRRYQAQGKKCRECPHFGVCTTRRQGRTIQVSVDEAKVRANRARVHTEEARPLLQIRRQRGEAPFGYFKQFGGLRRIAGRGLAYAERKALVAALGWNLLLIVKLLGGTDGATAWVKDRINALWALIRTMWGRRQAIGLRGPIPQPLVLTPAPNST
ncbi:MAG TPA: IS1182 family transposase [Candidatus Paceibacterota bacterium]|nr:IS1182 family transposase [Candidatus Paceibacterota bacterium]